MKPKYIVAAIFIAMAFIVADCTSSAHAEWEVRETKDRGSCFFGQEYTNDWALATFIYKDLSIILGLHRKSWDIPEGSGGTIYLLIDKGNEWSGKSVAISTKPHTEGTFLGVEISYETLFRISKGNSLQVRVGNQGAVLDLKGSGEAIRKTIECAKKLPQSNPFGTISNPSNPFDI